MNSKRKYKSASWKGVAYLNLLARQLIVTKIDKENYRKIALMSRDLINSIKQEYDLK